MSPRCPHRARTTNKPGCIIVWAVTNDIFRNSRMPEASEACSRWLSAATPPDLHAKKTSGTPAGCKIVGRVVVRWCRRSRSSTTGYRLRCLRHRFDQNMSFMTAKSISTSHGFMDVKPRDSTRWKIFARIACKKDQCFAPS